MVFIIFIRTRIIYARQDIRVWENVRHLTFRVRVYLYWNGKRYMLFQIAIYRKTCSLLFMKVRDIKILQISKIEFSDKNINCFQSLTILAKDSTSDGTQGSKYASFQWTISVKKSYMTKMNHRRTLRQAK